MPVLDSRLAALPAQKDDLSIAVVRKIHQPRVEVFEFTTPVLKRAGAGVEMLKQEHIRLNSQDIVCGFLPDC